MTCKEQNKILDDKIESSVNQYKVDRLNAEISAFSSGDLNKYEFLKIIDLNYKPNVLDKARFEFFPLGKTFSTGLDKTAQGYQEEGIIKLLKDIRNGLAGNVIIPARPPRPNDNGNNDNDNGNNDNGNNDNDNGNNDNGNNDNGNNDNGNDDNGSNDNGNDDNGNNDNGDDLSWMNDLQLYKKIALEVFSRYNVDKDSFELFTLRTFIDNINNEHVKNKKDAREEFKIVKKNVKSEALKEIVKDLEQTIFLEDDNDEAEGLDKDLLEAEELDRRFKNLISKKRRESPREGLDKDLLEAEEFDRFKNLISKKRCESLREYLKESEDGNPQDRANALKEYSKKAKYTALQIKVSALKKKLNNLPKTSSDNNDDSEDNQISDFVDEVLKKVSKEIVNDDNKKVSEEIVNDDNKKVNDDNKKKSKENITERIKKMEASENLFSKQFRDAEKILELSKKYKESNAKTNKMIKELCAKIKDKEAVSKNTDKAFEEIYTKEAQNASKEIEKYKMINDNLDMSSEKSEIINKLIELYSLIQIYYLNKIDNNLKANENIDNISIERDIWK